MTLPLEQAGQALAAESARYAAMGWMRGTSGNLSMTLGRDPLRLAVTASGRDKGELTSSDMPMAASAHRSGISPDCAGALREELRDDRARVERFRTTLR